MVVLSMRFTPHEESDFEKFVDFVTRQSCKCLIVKHDADEDVSRPHCHLVIDFNLTKSTFGQRFKVVFPDYAGNKDFQIKDCTADGDKPLWYICKMNPPDVLYKNGYSENDIKTFHEESNKYVEALKKQTNQKPEKEYKEKVKTLTFPQICAKALQEKYPRTSEYAGWNFGWKDDRLKVYHLVCDMLGKNGKVLDDIIIFRLMCGVMMIVEPESCKQLFRKKVMDKFDAEFD